MKISSRKSPSPPDWPSEADQDYERIRVIGRGAFAEVWLARIRQSTKHSTEEFVAIKGLSILTENEKATAAREIAILSELSHPNIIRLLHSYEPESDSANGRYIVLSFVNGPDIGTLLEKGGALGLPLARLIARQLISAVAYMHTRGVMHRDIKPDNLMLEGYTLGKKPLKDHLFWSDGRGCQDAVDKGKFKAVLVDFGFARANKFPTHERQQSRSILRLSAVGTKHFAAPELIQNVREKTKSMEALTECVSEYSMIGDAYSIGATISEITTGVPPGEDIKSYVTAYREKYPKESKEPCSKLLKFFRYRKGHHTIKLRLLTELPIPVSNLISSLMESNLVSRLSVREAQNHEWIGGYSTLQHGDVPSNEGDDIVPIMNNDAFK